MLKVCLNGSRNPGEHPGLPITAEELAAAAAEAVAAGADAIHLHPRAADGTQTLLATQIGAAVGAVRQVCPRTPVGVSTGLWITGGEVTSRAELVRGWNSLPASERPDFASVNLSEPGSLELAGILSGGGVGVEAGIWSDPDAARLARAPLPGLLRILVEIIDPVGDRAAEAADDVLGALGPAIGTLGADVPVLLHGEQDSTWPVLRHAARLDLDTRIGLEDTLTGPDGEPVDGNAALVRLARRIIGP